MPSTALSNSSNSSRMPSPTWTYFGAHEASRTQENIAFEKPRDVQASRQATAPVADSSALCSSDRKRRSRCALGAAACAESAVVMNEVFRMVRLVTQSTL